jgi:hypothetical protein
MSSARHASWVLRPQKGVKRGVKRGRRGQPMATTYPVQYEQIESAYSATRAAANKKGATTMTADDGVQNPSSQTLLLLQSKQASKQASKHT